MKDIIMNRKGLHLITRANGIVHCKPSKIKPKSPVATDKDPEWQIDMHARERDGSVFVNADQYASLKELSHVLAVWLIPLLKEMGVSPAEFLRKLANGFDKIQTNGGL